MSLWLMWINDGTPWKKGRNTTDNPRAPHIECATAYETIKAAGQTSKENKSSRVDVSHI